MEKLTGPWNEYQTSAPASDSGPWDAFQPQADPPKGYGLKAFGGDLASVVTKGVMAVPQAAVGLADIATGGRAGKALEDIGVRFNDANQIADSWKSDALKSQQQDFQQAEGLAGKASAALRSPGLIASTVAESIPSMFAGGALAKGAGLAVPALAGRAGLAAAGEGAIMAGQQAENIRQQTDDGLLTPGQSGLAAATGVAGGLLGAAGARAAKALGVGDIDQMIATGAATGVARQGLGVVNRAGRGALAEGIFEELPQSLAETGLQNIALDRNVTEGMADSAVLGTLAGGVMGGAAGAMSRPAIKPSEAMGLDPAAGPLSRAAATAVDGGETIQPELINAEQTQVDPAVAQAADGRADEIAPVVQDSSRTDGSEISRADVSGGNDGLQNSAATEAAPAVLTPDLVTLESRSIDELRQSLRNAQDPAIRRAVAAEIRRRREAMPDPLQQQETTLEPQAVETQQAVQEEQTQPATEPAPAVLGQSLTDTGTDMLGRGSDPLQSFIESENNVRRANEGLRSPAATSTGQRINQPGASMGTAMAGVRDGGNDATDAKPAANSDAGSGTGSAATGVSTLSRPERWRQNAIQAGKVARGLGLDPNGKRMAQIVSEIDEKDGNVQNAPQAANDGQAKAAPVEASTADRGDAAAAGAVSAKAGAGDVQADGVKSERFPPVRVITGLSMGPGGLVTPKPIADGKPLYREMNIGGLDDLLRMDSQAEVVPMFVSDNPDLAIGQGVNKGVRVTFRPDSLSGRENKKPGTGDIAGREYQTDIVAPRAVQSITMPAANIKSLRMLTRRALLSEFDRTDNADGTATFNRKVLKAVAKPEPVAKAPAEPVKPGPAPQPKAEKPQDAQLDAATVDATDATYPPASQAHQKAATAFAERLSKNRDSFVLMDAVKPSGARAKEAQSVSDLAKTMFGREVVFVKFKGRPLFNGAVSTTDPGKIFVNIESARPMMAVLGHELLHELRKSNPAAYNQLAKTLKSVTKDDYIYEALLKQKYRDQGLNWTPQDISEELYGDIVGDNFMDQKFWEALAGDKPILAKQLYRAVMNWLDKIASMFKRVKVRADGSMVLTLAEQADGSRPFGTQKYLQDIEAARSAVAQAMGQFGKTKAGADALSIADTKDNADVMNVDEDSWGGPEESKFDDLIYKLQDKQIDTKRVVEAIREAGGRLKDATNVYLQEELFHGRAAARTEDFVNKELAPLVNMMRLRGIDIPALDEYLHARHAEEANKLIAKRNPEIQDGGSGMTTKAAREYLAKLTPADKAKFESVAAKVDEILGTTRQMYADYSLESQEKVDGWGKMFDYYVPLMREDKDGGMGIGQGFSIKGKEVKGRTGSTRKVVDILANIAMQRERAIVRGEKNRVATALVGLAKTNPNKDFWSVGPPPAKKVYDPELDTVVERQDPLFKSRENVVVAKIKAKNGMVLEQAVMFNEDNERAMRMAAALKNLDAAGLEGLLGVSAKITRYFAAINTQYNPIFGAVNLVRDVQGALFNLTSTPLRGKSGIIGKNTLSALKGIYLDARASRDGKTPSSPWAKLWEEFQNEGGQTGFRDMFTNSADRAKAIERELNPTAWMDSPLGQVFTANGALKVPLSVAQKKATGMFDWLSDYNLAMENAVRLSAYKAAIDQGMSKQQAASLAKNLTVNFNRKGQVGQQAGALYAFFNASMQGTARLGQTLFDMEPGKPKTIRLSRTGKKIVYGGVLLGSMQAMLLAAAGFDEDEPPEFVRERSLIIPTGGNSYITIPMPLGLHVLPNLGRIPTEFAMGGFKNPAQMIEKMLVLVSGAFNPIGGGASLVQMLSPTAVDPMVAIAENKDWTGKPIAKTSHNQAIPGHLLTKDTASAPAKLLAEAINILSGGTEYTAGVLSPTPDQIDYLFGQVTGGVGREVSKVQQSGTAMVTGEDLPIYKVPLVGRFYGDTDTQSAQSGKFYAAINELNIHEAQIKGLRKDGRGAEASEYIRENPEARLFMAANAAERDVQKLRGLKRELVKNGAPADRVKEVEQRINDRMTRFNESVKRLREQEAA